MENPCEFCETEIVTTKTTKKAARLGKWGGSTISNITSSARRIQMDKEDAWGSLRDWECEHGQLDGSKISLTSGERSAVSSGRRLSDNSRDPGDLEDDVQSVSSASSDRRSKRVLDTAFNNRDMRSRRTANFFRDDFDDTMEQMIHDFDARFSNSFWIDDDNDDFFHRHRRSRNSNEFFSRPTLSSRSNFSRSRLLPSLFDSSVNDEWSERKSTFDDDYAESGIFSDRASSRQSNRSDEALKKEKSARQLAAEKFEVDIDVQGFKANELLVRTEGRRLTITAVKKDEDGNPVSNFRELKREFVLPEGVNPYDVTSNLMPDGFLRVEAPVGGRQASETSEQTARHSEDDVATNAKPGPSR